MDSALASAAPARSVAFADGLGVRHRVADARGNVDVLDLDSQLTSVPAFEFALRERVSRLSTFHHPYFAHVRSVDRLTHGDATLAIVSDAVEGTRLSGVIAAARQHNVTLDIGAALCLVRQLASSLASLHEYQRDCAHGAIALERLVLTPNARLIVVDYTMGAAIEQLRYSHQRYWKDLRVALPRSAGLPRFEERVDVTQIGAVALSLVLGRPLTDDDYPTRIAELVASAWALGTHGDLEPLPPGLRAWLARALQLDVRTAFATVAEAAAEFNKVVSADNQALAEPAMLEAFVSRYRTAVGPLAEAPKMSALRPAAVPVVTPPAPVRQSEPTPRLAEPIGSRLIDLPPPPSSRPSELTVAAAIKLPPIVTSPAPAPTPRVAAIPESVIKPAGAPLVAHGAPPALDISAPPVPSVRLSDIVPSLPEYRENYTESLADPLDHRSDVQHAPTRRGKISPRTAIIAGGALLAIVVVGFFAMRMTSSPPLPPVPTGTVEVTTNPAGAQVAVDGENKGVSPVTLTLVPGNHTLQLSGVGDARSIPVSVVAGTQLSQYIELSGGRATTGNLQVKTDPAGAQVSVDGVPRGTAPTVVRDLAPGEHSVVLTSDAGSVTQNVTVEAGAVASLVVPLGARDALSGWVSVSSPVDLQIFERGRLIGTSQTERIMLAAGSHQLEFVNDSLGFKLTRSVQVIAGRPSSIPVKLPTGAVALNATPWAEVWIDGEKVGETPIGNQQLTIGPHQVLFRNPELGEQAHPITVTLSSTTRVSVDMRKK